MTMINGMAETFQNLGCEIAAVTRETPEESSFSSDQRRVFLPTQRTMTISTVEHLKQRAIEVLDERIERRIIPAGDVLPDVTVKSFDGKTFPISQLYSEKPLLLVFLRASW